MRTSWSPFELVRVIAVRHVRDHVLWLEFSDGVSGEVDLSDVLVGPVFEPLRDPREFARVRLGAATVEWPNGADWAPELLYERVLAGNSSESQPKDDAWLDDSRHSRDVPELSRFYGIVIHMFYADHARPHFHAWFGGEWIAVEIDGDGVRGSFPPGRLPLVFKWRDAHREELRENWERLHREEPPLPIAPLD